MASRNAKKQVIEEADVMSASLFQLTDYNNFKDLSGFIKEYNKAMALINKCSEFYQSFLTSKLISYDKIYSYFQKGVVLPYSYQVLDGQTKRDHDIISRSFGSDYSKLYTTTIAIRTLATQMLKEKYDANTKCKFTIKDNGCGSNWGAFRSICLKKDENIVYRYGELKIEGNFNWRNKYDSEKNDEYLNKTIAKLGYKSLSNFETDATLFWNKANDEYENILGIAAEKYILEHKDAFDSAYCVYIKNEIPNMVDSMIRSLENAKLPNDLKKELKEDIKKYKNSYIFNTCEFTIKSIWKYVKIDDVIAEVKEQLSNHTIGSFSSINISDLFNKKKLNEDVKNFVDEQNNTCLTFFEKYAGYIKDCRMYILDRKNKLHYFCNESELDKVKITLNAMQNNLICKYHNTNRQKSAPWPGWAPWIVTETTREIRFDVGTNDVISFDERVDKHEEKCDY